MKETRNFLNNILVNNITNTPMVLRQKSFKINPYKKRLESMKETRNFLYNIFKLNDLSAQIKHWKKQHTLQVMQKVFWYCATLGVRPIIAKYGWQTWNILGKRWKVLNNLYTWPLILHIFVYRCCALLATLTKARFYPQKNLSVYETNIIVLWRFVSSGSSVTKKLHLVTKLYRNETQNDVPVQGFFFSEIF